MKQRKNKIQESRAPIPAWSVLLLVALCFIVYANGLRGEFVWDDHLTVVRNPSIRSWANIPRAFTSTLSSFLQTQGATGSGNPFDLYYRPLQTVIYILVYQAGGLSPLPYHLANVILH